MSSSTKDFVEGDVLYVTSDGQQGSLRYKVVKVNAENNTVDVVVLRSDFSEGSLYRDIAARIFTRTYHIKPKVTTTFFD